MGEGWRSHFPSKDEQRWLRRAGRLGVVVVGVRLHPLPCYSPFTGRGARTGHSHGCFKRWRDRCLSTVSGPRLLSLSDSTTNCLLLHNPLPLSRPTACLYWLISLFFSLSIFTPLTVAFSLPSSFANSSSAIPAFFVLIQMLLDWFLCDARSHDVARILWKGLNRVVYPF